MTASPPAPVRVTAPGRAGSAGELPRRPLRAALLHNPRSGRNRAGPGLLQRVWADAPGLGFHAARTPGEVGAVLSGLLARGLELLVVSGGDGTVKNVLTALLPRTGGATPPLLALLPSGTANMIAGDVGLPGPRAGALRRLQAWAADPGRPPALVHRPVLRVQAGSGSEPACGMFFGAGAIHHATRYCLSRLHPRGIRGRLAPALTLVRYLAAAAAGWTPPAQPLAISVDGGPAETAERLLLLATTLDHLLWGLRPFWGAGAAPLRLTTVAARPRSLLRALPGLLRGRPGRFGAGDGYASRNAGEVRLWFDGGGTLDGEVLEADRRRGPVVLTAAGPVAFVRC